MKVGSSRHSDSGCNPFESVALEGLMKDCFSSPNESSSIEVIVLGVESLSCSFEVPSIFITEPSSTATLLVGSTSTEVSSTTSPVLSELNSKHLSTMPQDSGQEAIPIIFP